MKLLLQELNGWSSSRSFDYLLLFNKKVVGVLKETKSHAGSSPSNLVTERCHRQSL